MSAGDAVGILLVAIAAVLLCATLYRRFNRWYIARRNGWRTGWEDVARRRGRW